MSQSQPDPERRLNEFGLSTERIHLALRPALSRASNRTSLALRSTPGTDIYHDGMEHFAQLLAQEGWRLVYVDGQARLLHPQGQLALALASGINVGQWNLRMPRTRRKGKATRKALAQLIKHPSLFDSDEKIEQESALVEAAKKAPLWFLLCERTERGPGLHLEFARPASMTPGGSVNLWADHIPVPFLDLGSDMSVFNQPDDGDGDFDVAVEPR
jgi:hypothetical protein